MYKLDLQRENAKLKQENAKLMGKLHVYAHVELTDGVSFVQTYEKELEAIRQILYPLYANQVGDMTRISELAELASEEIKEARNYFHGSHDLP